MWGLVALRPTGTEVGELKQRGGGGRGERRATGSRSLHPPGRGRSGWWTLGGRREGWSVRLARALKPPPLSRRHGAGGCT